MPSHMTATEEDFVHYVECIYSLNHAWSILQDLGAVERPSALRAAAFRFALTAKNGHNPREIFLNSAFPQSGFQPCNEITRNHQLRRYYGSQSLRPVLGNPLVFEAQNL